MSCTKMRHEKAALHHQKARLNHDPANWNAPMLYQRPSHRIPFAARQRAFERGGQSLELQSPHHTPVLSGARRTGVEVPT